MTQSSPLVSDRRVHARYGRTEIVRYGRRGHWYEEDMSGTAWPWRVRLDVVDAAERAAEFVRQGGKVFLGIRGGNTFDRKVRSLSDVREESITESLDPLGPCPSCGCPADEYDGHVCEDYLAAQSLSWGDLLAIRNTALVYIEAEIADDRSLGRLLKTTSAEENDRYRDEQKRTARQVDDARARLALLLGRTWPPEDD